MTTSSLRRQALILTAANAFTRGLGFLLRLVMARHMSTEALGVMELAGSVSMLAMTPVTAGLPTAMSRLAARRTGKDRQELLRSGLSLVLRMSLLLMPALLLLTPGAAWLLGDRRTIPALAISAPSVLLAGLCGIYSGYCIGMEAPQLPARNECLEQLVRTGLIVGLLLGFSGADTALQAAMPGAAGLAGGCVVLLLFCLSVPAPRQARPDHDTMTQLLRLAWPMMLARLCASGMRTLNAVLLPVCLRHSGLSASAATAQYGLLTGMAMPLMLLPGVVTGALCTVSTPAVSRAEGCGTLRRLVRRLYLTSGLIGLAASGGLLLLAEPLGLVIFRQAALPPVIRLLSPLALLASLRQVQFGMIAGLGLQGRALTGTLFSSALTLVLTAWLAPMPWLRLYGAVLAALAGQSAAVGWNAAILHRALKERAL